MKSVPSVSLIAAAVLAALFAAGAPGAAAQSGPPQVIPDDQLPPPSEAENLLFLHPQMTALKKPGAAVVYDFAVESASAPRTSDRVSISTADRADGQCCSVHTDFLSGTNAIHLPDLDDPIGNPMTMYFLENEVRLMERATKGQQAHFRRRIRQALADEAKVSDGTARWNGQQIATRVVQVAPFVNDQYRARYEREATTYYEFVLSDAVPGGIVRGTATLPGAKPGDPPQATRTLTLADPQPAATVRK